VLSSRYVHCTEIWFVRPNDVSAAQIGDNQGQTGTAPRSVVSRGLDVKGDRDFGADDDVSQSQGELGVDAEVFAVECD